MARKYEFSPFGPAVHPWIGKADTKFANPGDAGLFKTGLTLSGPEAIAFREKIDAGSQAAFDDFFENGKGKDVKPADRKKWSVYYPYTVDEDDNGNPTGDITFDFKQNAEIKLKDGTKKAITISVVDAKNKPMHKPVWGGSIIRTMFSMRAIPMVSLKQVGVRLDFGAVQVKQLSQGGGPGFGEVEGYEEEDDTSTGGHTASGTSDKDTGGDY